MISLTQGSNSLCSAPVDPTPPPGSLPGLQPTWTISTVQHLISAWEIPPLTKLPESELCSGSAPSSPPLLPPFPSSLWDLSLGYCFLPGPFLAASALALPGLSVHCEWHLLTSADRKGHATCPTLGARTCPDDGGPFAHPSCQVMAISHQPLWPFSLNSTS